MAVFNKQKIKEKRFFINFIEQNKNIGDAE